METLNRIFLPELRRKARHHSGISTAWSKEELENPVHRGKIFLSFPRKHLNLWELMRVPTQERISDILVWCPFWYYFWLMLSSTVYWEHCAKTNTVQWSPALDPLTFRLFLCSSILFWNTLGCFSWNGCCTNEIAKLHFLLANTAVSADTLANS